MNSQDIYDLYEYNYWANHRVRDVAETLSHDHFSKDLGSSHRGIHGTLFHIMGAEEIWLKRWKGESPASFNKAEDYPTFDALTQHWDMVEHEMMGFVHMLKTEDDIRKEIVYRDLKGNEYAQPLYQLMQHLINHSTYHRGQVVTMLRQLGVKPTATDMVAFYRERIS